MCVCMRVFVCVARGCVFMCVYACVMFVCVFCSTRVMCVCVCCVFFVMHRRSHLHSIHPKLPIVLHLLRGSLCGDEWRGGSTTLPLCQNHPRTRVRLFSFSLLSFSKSCTPKVLPPENCSSFFFIVVAGLMTHVIDGVGVHVHVWFAHVCICVDAS